MSGIMELCRDSTKLKLQKSTARSRYLSGEEAMIFHHRNWKNQTSVIRGISCISEIWMKRYPYNRISETDS